MVLRSSTNKNNWPGVKTELNECSSIEQLSWHASNENLFSMFIFVNGPHNSYFVHFLRDLEISSSTNKKFCPLFREILNKTCTLSNKLIYLSYTFCKRPLISFIIIEVLFFLKWKYGLFIFWKGNHHCHGSWPTNHKACFGSFTLSTTQWLTSMKNEIELQSSHHIGRHILL